MEPQPKNIVAFAGSAFWECRNHAMKHGKVHIGRVRENGLASTCQSHQYGRTISQGNYKIIRNLDDERRLCKFCLDKWPEIMHKLLTNPPKPKMFYLLIHPTTGEGGGYDYVISKETSGSIRRRLINNPEFLRELKNNIRQTGNVKLVRAHLVDVDFKIREVVESITFKE